MKKLETKNLIVKPSNIPNAGNGLFAKKNFKANQIIGYFKGEIITNDRADKISDSDDPRKYYFVYLDEYYSLDTYGSDSPIKYANDANGLTKILGLENNSQINVTKNKKKAYIYATTDIAEGSEIFLNYGEEYWSNI